MFAPIACPAGSEKEGLRVVEHAPLVLRGEGTEVGDAVQGDEVFPVEIASLGIEVFQIGLDGGIEGNAVVQRVKISRLLVVKEDVCFSFHPLDNAPAGIPSHANACCSIF